MPILLAQAVVAGGATFALLDLVMDIPEARTIWIVFLAALGGLALLVAAELWSSGSRHVELATAEMTRGSYAAQFWFGGVLDGIVVPAALLTFALVIDTTSPWPAACAGAAALFGLYAYEDSFVRAGQSVPLS